MIRVTIGNNLNRQEVIVDESTTLKVVLDENGIDYLRGVMHLDGSALLPGDLSKTFASFGVTENCYLLNVIKADNGR